MTMEFIKITEQSFQLVGMNFYGDPFENKSAWEEENGIGELWRRFMKFYLAHEDAIKQQVNKHEFIEIHLTNDETKEKGLYEIFVGTQVKAFEAIPEACVAKQLPLRAYAVFSVKGDEIASDWYHYMHHEWQPTSGYKIIESYSMILYDEHFKGMDQLDESIVYAYVPLVRDDACDT